MPTTNADWASLYYKDAAAAETAAAQKSAQQLQDSTNQAEALYAPGIQANTAALNSYMSLLGINNTGGTVDNSQQLTALQNTPGYQFTQQQGTAAINTQAAATGMLNSGNTLKAIDQYNTGLASQTYQNAVTNAQNAYTSTYGNVNNAAQTYMTNGENQASATNAAGAAQGAYNNNMANMMMSGGNHNGNSNPGGADMGIMGGAMALGAMALL